MEYYFLAPVGILLSGKERTKEALIELMTQALQSETEDLLSVLNKHQINRVLTFTAPRFKFEFNIQDKKIIEIN